ncbi:MAG: family 16 glycosylhydrolase [Ferruginibacter sp.]|nr:family 16 glycosylhydrolase [Chitinophagaceae bacterium]
MKTIIAALLIVHASCNKNNGGSPAPQQPSVSINSITQPEGNTTGGNFGFTISLSGSFPNPVTVTYSTLDGTAKGGEDFTAVTNQPVTFQPNETQKTIIISITGDDLREGDDAFTVMLTGATNASIGQFSGTGTIINDDTRVPFTNAGYDAPTSYPGYTLAWADEFNGGALNTAAWTVEGGDGCPGLCGWGNNELEYYTGRPENLFFQDGKLLIEARKESFSGKNYTSSKIVTRGKKVFKYGRVDIRAKLPKGKGIWPALWMLPQNNVYGGWPTSGEIDIMELVGHEPGKAYGTLHYGPGPGSTSISRGYTLPAGTFNDEFHVFSLEWKIDQLKIFVDGNLFSTVNKADIGSATWPFNEDFFFIFNLAVGGNWPGNPDTATYFPQWLVVDYVRVYQ